MKRQPTTHPRATTAQVILPTNRTPKPPATPTRTPAAAPAAPKSGEGGSSLSSRASVEVTPHSALRILHSRRRTGKIARLPKRYRDFINFMLSEGYPYKEIIHDLEDTPGFHQIITKQNLSTWKNGGYKDWLEDQQWIIQRRLDQDFALDLLEKNEKTPIHEATLHVAVTQVAQALRHFDPAGLKHALHDNPANYLRLLDVLAKLSYTGLNCEHRRQEKAQNKEIWELTVREFAKREEAQLRSKAAELKALKSKEAAASRALSSTRTKKDPSRGPANTAAKVPSPKPNPKSAAPPVAPKLDEGGLVAPKSDEGGPPQDPSTPRSHEPSIARAIANDSPSPGGEGRGEGETFSTV
jgi:hypothetical protein